MIYALYFTILVSIVAFKYDAEKEKFKTVSFRENLVKIVDII